MSEDPHSPTEAGPAPGGEQPVAAEPVGHVADPAPEPTPVVGAGQATWDRPAGSALPDSAEPVDPHPEKLVGAAFAGGVVAAIVLKGLARRRQS